MFNPDEIRTKVLLVAFLVVGFELGIAFLIRAVSESGSDPHD